LVLRVTAVMFHGSHISREETTEVFPGRTGKKGGQGRTKKSGKGRFSQSDVT